MIWFIFLKFSVPLGFVFGYFRSKLLKLNFVNFVLKWRASSRWSSGPNSAWGSIGMMTIEKTHPTLFMFLLTFLVILNVLWPNIPIFAKIPIWPNIPISNFLSDFLNKVSVKDSNVLKHVTFAAFQNTKFI